MAQSSKINTMLNMLKGLACIGVVFTHIVFPGWCGKFVTIASAYAVPVFFMTAGYLCLWKRNRCNETQAVENNKNFHLWVCTFLYLPGVCCSSKSHVNIMVHRKFHLEYTNEISVVLYNRLCSTAVVFDCNDRNIYFVDIYCSETKGNPGH